MSKVYISADLEGISGVVHNEQTQRDGREHEVARRLMTAEVNAAIEGALAAGATEVVVNDSHGTMRNLLPEQLHHQALLITGSPKPLGMMEGIQDGEYQCAMFVGYHAAMGHSGVLSHTIWGSVVRDVRLNGTSLGETGINAAVAGHFNLPVALVTGDDQLCAEAAALLPQVVTAEVKQARGRYVARCLHPEVARTLIRERAQQGVAKASALSAYKLSNPVSLELEFLNSGQAEAASILPDVTALNATTLQYTGPDTLAVFRMLRALINLGGAL